MFFSPTIVQSDELGGGLLVAWKQEEKLVLANVITTIRTSSSNLEAN